MHYKSHCRGQMKKSVTYEVNICVSKSGVIDEAQCERYETACTSADK